MALTWQTIRCNILPLDQPPAGLTIPPYIGRAKVPGGWLIFYQNSPAGSMGASGFTFYPDPEHKWDGNSLP